ncbi:MAG: hypothetical protein IMW98_00350 [Firmicutes bacterium]|nr:hypothetical protein [Bacillota bacterium]
MLLLFAGAMALLFLGLLAAATVWEEARHSPRLRALLWREAGFSAAGAAVIAWLVAPSRRADTLLAWGSAAFLPLFLLSGYATVHTLKREALRAIDEPLAQLRRRLSRLQREFDEITWEVRRLERAQAPQAGEEDDPLARWQRVVAAWEGQPGLTRIRSLKVEEWRQAYARLDDLALEAQRRALQAEAPQDPARAEQREVQLALVEMERARRRRRRAEDEREVPGAPALASARARRAELEREIRAVQEEIQALLRRRQEAQRDDVPLE